MAADDGLLEDARTVLRTQGPIEHEVQATNGKWYCRRILPYQTQDDGVEGVVITFSDVTERRHAADSLEAARRSAELANIAKSRFLAAASHDLRQPLQTLALLQGLLARNVESDKAKNLVVRLDETLGAMGGMLNTLLDINQIEAGMVRAAKTSFPVSDLLDRMRDEFTYHAQAKGLELRVVTCSMSIHTDPTLLEQMVRNLISNALKYTERGRVLLGCRRRGPSLSIEIWDTGIGIALPELKRIFEEYHQIDNAARERSRGLGLGLSIVERLGTLLEHKVRVLSWPGRGSMFAIDVPLPPARAAPRERPETMELLADISVPTPAQILIVEDDPELCELLAVYLRDSGHHVTSVPDGLAALAALSGSVIAPDIVIADYNLPKGMNGLEVIAAVRDVLQHELPVLVLTGDVSAGTLRAIADAQCVQLTKPVKLEAIATAIYRLLPERATVRVEKPAPVIVIIDDDREARESVRAVLEPDGMVVRDFDTCEMFLADFPFGQEACLLVDAYLPGMGGVDMLLRLREREHKFASILITARSDANIAVAAMQAGAVDFIEKPVTRDRLIAAVLRALDLARDSGKRVAWHAEAAAHIAGLTAREREVMRLVLAGHPSKNIAADLGISQRTVENHRAAIMKKTGAASLPALARLALAAEPE
jgi:two-component system CheB/CheR fusion protein